MDAYQVIEYMSKKYHIFLDGDLYVLNTKRDCVLVLSYDMKTREYKYVIFRENGSIFIAKSAYIHAAITRKGWTRVGASIEKAV